MFAGGGLTREKAERTCKWYFYSGFCMLPLMWLVVVLTFAPYRHVSESIRFYVGISAVLFLSAVIILSIWYAVVYTSLLSSNIWVIRPEGDGHQGGFFASGVYSAQL